MSDGSRGEPQRIAELNLYATEDGRAQVFLRSQGSTVSLSQDGLDKSKRKLASKGNAHAA